MTVLELMLADSQSAYLAGAHRVLRAAGEKKECEDIASVLLFFLKNSILSYMKINFKTFDEKEDWLAEFGAQLPAVLREYRPCYNATLPSYSFFYFKKARGIVTVTAGQAMHDVFAANGEYLETITENKKNKVKKSYEAEGKKLVKRKVVLSIDEAVRGNRALAELFGHYDSE